MSQPYLTAGQPGIGGRLKVNPEDFVVEEIPLYLPSGEGQHLYVTIEKRGISTFGAIRTIARALNVHQKDIGYAGLKDAQAVTRQTLSIPNVSPEAVADPDLDLPKIKILSATPHKNKLKTGHLSGNRFIIRVRDVSENSLPQVEATMAILATRGVPNFFGEQRFGNRGNTARLGEAFVRQDAETFVSEYLGRPQPDEPPAIYAVHQLVDEGKWEDALAQWPHSLSDERRVLAAVAKANGQPDVAFNALNKKLKGFFVSAFQSALFNQLMADRLDTLDTLQNGDVAYIHGKGAAFVVEDVAMEQPRAKSFEISPSGPLFGTKTLMATGEPGQKEQAMMEEYDLSPDNFKIPGLKIHGARRPYRIQVKQPNIWWDDGLMVSFELEPGAYATTVLAEVMKTSTET